VALSPAKHSSLQDIMIHHAFTAFVACASSLYHVTFPISFMSSVRGLAHSLLVQQLLQYLELDALISSQR
jgi:hypothetical protein